MRWAKTLIFIALGGVVGGLISGYVVFQYMVRFGISWNQWAASMNEEERAGDAIGTVAALTKLRAGRADEARNALEWRLTNDVTYLAKLKRDGHDPEGYTTKAILAIRNYRQINPWTSGNVEVDKLTADDLSDSAAASRPAR